MCAQSTLFANIHVLVLLGDSVVHPQSRAHKQKERPLKQTYAFINSFNMHASCTRTHTRRIFTQAGDRATRKRASEVLDKAEGNIRAYNQVCRMRGNFKQSIHPFINTPTLENTHAHAHTQTQTHTLLLPADSLAVGLLY